MKTFLLVVVGVLALEVLLIWGYFAVLERGSGTTVARGFLGAALVAASLALGVWLLVSFAVPIYGD
jgi:glucose uptake protein GlcU